VLVALGVVALAGCGSVSSNDAAAEVDGAEISRDEFEETLNVLSASPETTGINADLETGTVSGDAGRTVLSGLVTAQANEQFLASSDESVTDAEREEFESSLDANSPLRALPADVFEQVANLQAGGAARGRIAAEDAEERYQASPEELGVTCVRHILVADEEAAQDVVAELEQGADFAELAGELSTDQGTADSGGAVVNPQTGAPCLSTSAALETLDPTFVAAAAEAVPGEPTEPVETSFGWHVILARPYSEVAEAVDSIYGAQLFADYLRAADVSVDPRYGRWDAESASIVPLA
jgi:foldase protein PrsA